MEFMIHVFFLIGALTSLGCGWNVMTCKSNVMFEAVWIAGGAIGAGMMYAAISMGAA
ncbi:hypothetical protein OLZ32_27955 [Rhizobium sp. 1AS11]|uniref:hypothetical protein n=1 Tax=Rhizobium acaciae TaxID=2989736 RepID=UPI0022220E72|nr:hypothetical protein [Rhizobium acaciae]MCW1412188.1 hypothetical protein [Rhizobium acaciae]MCW1744203.1 hypothetical protein [Rhizobium acaciae]